MWNEVLIPGVPVGTDRTGMREAVGGPAFVFAVVWFVFFRYLEDFEDLAFVARRFD